MDMLNKLARQHNNFLMMLCRSVNVRRMYTVYTSTYINSVYKYVCSESWILP